MHYEKFADGTVKCIEDEIPFEIPDSWAWTRLGAVFSHNTGKALNATNNIGTLKKYITTSNVYWDYFVLDSVKEMYFTDDELEKCTIVLGDLLVCEGGDIGRSAIWDKDYSICIQNHLHRLRPILTACVQFYYYIFYLYKQNDMINGNGIGLQGLSSNRLHSLLVPFPPYKEQIKIAEIVQIYWNIVEKIEAEQTNISSLVQSAKSRILDLAIRGKLVPQNPDDEPASVLLERIKAEKEELIKQGKIKRDKKESTIFKGEDNSYYDDIPQTWNITALNNVCWLENGKFESVGKLPYLEAKVLRGSIQPTLQNEGNYIQVGTKVILVDGENSGEVFVAPFAGYMGSTFKILQFSKYVDEQYIVKFIEHYRSVLKESKTGSAIPHLNKNLFKQLQIGIPPVTEQKRIVDTIEKYFTYLDNIAQSLA